MHEYGKRILDKAGTMHSDHRMTDHAGDSHRELHDIEKRHFSMKKTHKHVDFGHIRD